MSDPQPSPLERARAAFDAGDYALASDLLARAALADPANAEILALLSDAYSHRGMHLQARSVMERAVALEPASAERHLQLAATLERSQDRPAAVRALQRCLELDPTREAARTRLAALGGAPAPPPPAPAPTVPPEASPAVPPATIPAAPPATEQAAPEPPIAPPPPLAPPPSSWAEVTQPLPAPPPPAGPGEYVHVPAPGAAYGVASGSRANLCLALALIGGALCLPGMICNCLVVATPILGGVAWHIGRQELQRIDTGELPDTTRSTAQAGIAIGIVDLVIGLLAALAMAMYFIYGLALSSGASF